MLNKTTAATTTTTPVPQLAWNSLQLGDLIGNGSFGDVYKGRWNGRDVAIIAV